MKKIIYFDNAATSGTKPDTVIPAICDCLEHVNANPGRSGHSLSVKAAEVIYTARETIGEFFNVKKSENIVLTKNATEALNIAIHGSLEAGAEVITTSMEHNSVLRPLNHLQNRGIISLKIIMADSNGAVPPDRIRKAITGRTKLVVVTSASNVTGSKIDLEGIHKICLAENVKLLVDGAQGAGAMKIDMEKTPLDFLAITGHKHLFGPQGTGALIVKDPDKLSSLMQGGTGSLSDRTVQPDFHPDKFEAGTLNTPGYAGLAAGIRFLLNIGIDNVIKSERDLVKYLIGELSVIEEIKVYAPDTDRVATVSFNIKGATASDVSHYLDAEWGICSRPGLHCAPEAHRTLNTFPCGAVRFSLSCFNTVEEIDISIKALKTFARRSF
jgi:cysteine desulfurase/selenocysteine lyase